MKQLRRNNYFEVRGAGISCHVNRICAALVSSHTCTFWSTFACIRVGVASAATALCALIKLTFTCGALHYEHNIYKTLAALFLCGISYIDLTDVHYSLGCCARFGTEARSERLYIFICQEREHLSFKIKRLRLSTRQTH
jgi:hypothetical protein